MKWNWPWGRKIEIINDNEFTSTSVQDTKQPIETLDRPSKKPLKAVFIPHIKKDPVKSITEEHVD